MRAWFSKRDFLEGQLILGQVSKCHMTLPFSRSGPKIKQRKSTVYDPMAPSLTGSEIQHVKYYQKDLVR